MSKLGSLEYHAGNLVFFAGVILLLVCPIFIAFYITTNSGTKIYYLIGMGTGIIVGAALIYIGLHILKIDRQKSERGIVIGLRERHEISVKSKGNKVFLLVDKIPKLEFEAKYLEKKSVNTTIGDREKHDVTVMAQASAWSGEVDKFVYVDNVLLLKDERPIW